MKQKVYFITFLTITACCMSEGEASRVSHGLRLFEFARTSSSITRRLSTETRELNNITMLKKKKIIDLTHTIHSKIPTWTGSCGFTRVNDIDYDDFKTGPTVRVQSFKSSAGAGTHIDAPSHFFRGGKNIDDLSLEDFITPACVIDITHQSFLDPDYKLQPDDIIKYEKNFGRIPKFATVIAYTGWYKYWSSPNKYRNTDSNGIMHFPGFSRLSAELLLSRDITSIGIDTLSPDGSDAEYPVHHVILGAGKTIIENLNNVENLPAQGATLISLPQKISEATEASIRVIGLLDT